MENLIVKNLELNDTSSTSDSPTVGDCPSKCSLCTHYQFQGRQGGHCNLLNVTVRGGWNACNLGESLFSPCWKNMAWVKSSPAPILS